MKIAKYSTRHLPALGLVAVLSTGMAFAGSEFSADSVQRGPKGEMSSSKMYVGDGRVRTEMSHQGQQVIRVTDEKRGVEWIMFPDQKKYMERKLGGPGGQPPSAKPSPADDPCGGMPGLICHKIGEEEIGGRTAVKWEMETTQGGQTMKSTQWIDKQRGVPLRQEMPNGQTTELKLVGEEELNGRKVEKWEMVATAPGQPDAHSFQWFDEELDLAVRQEFPGGIVSELTNIRVGKQPDELFNVPAGYERMAAPMGMPEANPGAEPGH